MFCGLLYTRLDENRTILPQIYYERRHCSCAGEFSPVVFFVFFFLHPRYVFCTILFRMVREKTFPSRVATARENEMVEIPSLIQPLGHNTHKHIILDVHQMFDPGLGPLSPPSTFPPPTHTPSSFTVSGPRSVPDPAELTHALGQKDRGSSHCVRCATPL